MRRSLLKASLCAPRSRRARIDRICGAGNAGQSGLCAGLPAHEAGRRCTAHQTGEHHAPGPDGYVKVLDFWIAKTDPKKGWCTHEETLRNNGGPANATRVSVRPPRIHVSPTGCVARRWTRARILEALGVVLYEMVEEARPFRGDTPSDLHPPS